MKRLPLPVVLPTLLLALALSACQREAAGPNDTATAQTPPANDQPVEDVPPATAPAVTPPASDTLARFDGYGDLRFGMSAEDARKAWGGELKGEAAADGGCYYLRPIWAQNAAEFGFMIENGKFARVDVGNDKETAPGGGKRGMSADEIRKLYAGRVEEQPHKYVDGGKNLRIGDAGGGAGALVFETDAAGKVTAWRIGVPPQVDYVEGCS
ncbi:lectin [Lysobacter sp. ESA13C]|uniref:lectin n=1 Tax=unclassified Lysobacter TaxID=2635362 RepID=UPI001CC09E09|nr:lectin [Lysobacter sp. ESA13C]